ncbi:MBL fold metallo-hydrolase [Geitlerinema calcuttense]|uniref:MBL fold metallo-hydrolase n=1 Tax=Geitlerinema calcuttense NRMC-F 0142 TaxID=2922238 RepID=A0ABT7LZD2_9CYAN|nr:MBL fold metallo-hydrolase [Geitlerinema calcuttense]MDL5057363.1 MBL fold metallo-hydrolase [Geitlerinema calcuttense NRMC-F 0142]
MHLTWLDSNSWLVEIGQKRIAIDPWLVGVLSFGNQEWLFKGVRSQDRPIPESIDLILLSQGLEDHAHPPTLKRLDRNIPVVASASAAKVVQKLGYRHVYPLLKGETWKLDNHLEIRATQGTPLGPFTLENGYLIRDLHQGTSLYYEPHGNHDPQLKDLAPIDVAIAPIINLSIPAIGSIIQGPERALELAQQIRPQFLLPTAAGGDIRLEGLINVLLKAKGSTKALQAQLQQHHLPTQIIEPQPGERIELKLKQPAAP